MKSRVAPYLRVVSRSEAISKGTPTPATSFFLRLPVPPSTNHLFATIGRRRVKSQKYKAWLTEAGWEVVRRRPDRLLGRVNFSMEVPRNLRRDLDNFLKAPLDLLVEHSLIEDDSKVERITIKWHDEDLDEAFIEVWSVPDGKTEDRGKPSTRVSGAGDIGSGDS